MHSSCSSCLRALLWVLLEVSVTIVVIVLAFNLGIAGGVACCIAEEGKRMSSFFNGIKFYNVNSFNSSDFLIQVCVAAADTCVSLIRFIINFVFSATNFTLSRALLSYLHS